MMDKITKKQILEDEVKHAEAINTEIKDTKKEEIVNLDNNKGLTENDLL